MPHALCSMLNALSLKPRTSHLLCGKAIEQGKLKLPIPLPGLLEWLIESNNLKFQCFLVTFLS